MRGRFFFSVNNKYRSEHRNVGRLRREEVVFNRIRLGHLKLNGTLKHIDKHLTGFCGHCHEEESITHVIMHCQRHKQENHCMKEEMKETSIHDFILRTILKIPSFPYISTFPTGHYYIV